MENLSGNIVALLQYLAPGFVVAWIFYGFTSHPKPSQFERIVQALVFTVIVRLIVEAERIAAEWIGNRFFVMAPWSPNADLAAALLTSIVVGLGFALKMAHGCLAIRCVGRPIPAEDTIFWKEWSGHTSGKKTLSPRIFLCWLECWFPQKT